MKAETIEKILNFLKNNEGKQIPSKWFNSIIKYIEKLENHPDGTQYRHKGYLFLSNRNITKLPNDLYVEGYLSLTNCKQLIKLPDDLYVGGDLRLDDTNIKKLPDNLYIDGYLELTNCKQLTKLPDNLRIIGGFLALENCEKVIKLPDNLYVGETLIIIGTSIEEIPDNLYVGGGIYIYDTPLANKYTNKQIREIVASTGGQIIGEIFR